MVETTDLILHLKEKWFLQIKHGQKKIEYREIKPYWTKRIEGRTYDRVVIIRAYPKCRDKSNCLYFKWNGYTTGVLTDHEEMGSCGVYQIDLSERLYD